METISFVARMSENTVTVPTPKEFHQKNEQLLDGGNHFMQMKVISYVFGWKRYPEKSLRLFNQMVPEGISQIYMINHFPSR